MLIKGFAILLLILIPFFIYSSKRQHISAPKIIYFTPTPSILPSPTSSPTIKIGVSPTVTQVLSNPTTVFQQIITSPVQPSQQNVDIGNFIYLNSSVLSNNTTSVTLDSTDSPQSITDWYKNKISQTGMNTTSFITTNTNDNVSNKLIATGKSKQIQVEINKSSADSHVKISVTISNQ